MPAPAVYVLAVVGTIGAAFAFKHVSIPPCITSIKLYFPSDHLGYLTQL